MRYNAVMVGKRRHQETAPIYQEQEAAPEQLTVQSETISVRGMTRAVEQTRQLLPPVTKEK
jgi:hypothetical protein